MDNQFQYAGRDFKLNKIDAFKQFHIVRRIGPTLADLIPSLKVAIRDPKQFEALPESEKFDVLAKFVSPIMNGLSKLSDEDAENVLNGLLGAVEVKQPAGNWAKVVQNNLWMIQDLELPSLLQLAGRSFMFNLSGFFSALPQT